MKKVLGIISTILFFIGLASYIAMFFGNDNFLLGGVIVSAIGLILAFFAGKGVYKRIGLIGNAIFIIVAFIFPLIVTTFFWNKP
ncbi:hypothetical protein V7150_22005 [Neobacillus drentensis]|uniref:hypothetical protein n=1 Tax=Neobacillus drentensis TaxID=220684 RepID=UPI003000752B